MDPAHDSIDDLEDVDIRDISGVFLALERAARIPKFRRLNLREVLKLENWDAYRKV